MQWRCKSALRINLLWDSVESCTIKFLGNAATDRIQEKRGSWGGGYAKWNLTLYLCNSKENISIRKYKQRPVGISGTSGSCKYGLSDFLSSVHVTPMWSCANLYGGKVSLLWPYRYQRKNLQITPHSRSLIQVRVYPISVHSLCYWIHSVRAYEVFICQCEQT